MALAAILTRRSSRSHLSLPFPLRSLLFSSSPSPSLSSSSSPSINPNNLQSLLSLISQSKSNSKSLQEGLNLIRSSCSSSTIKPTKELICSAIWELRYDWESAVLAFRWARGRISGCERVMNLMVWVLGNGKRFDLAWSLVRRMHRQNMLTKETMVILMERYVASNEVSKAIKTFHVMEKFKINADLTTLYALLRALCKNRNVEEAEELLLVKRKFFPLETEGFNIVLDGWCNVIVDVVEAKRVWREMSNCCITPDGTSYSHLICCYSKVGNLFDALRLYDQMKSRSWVPGLVVYNSLIYVLIRDNCFKEAQKTFDKILEVGLKPDIETYNSMISPLCEGHKVEEAREVLNNMLKNEVHPTIDTYNAFAKSEDLEGTLKLLKIMKDVGFEPDSYTFLLIINKFFRLNESESALRMWSEMSVYNVIPDSSHYAAMVQGLVKHGWIPKAMEFYNEMRSKGFPSDPKLEKLFETFVSSRKNHWGRGGKEFILTQPGKRNPNAGDVRIHQGLGEIIF